MGPPLVNLQVPREREPFPSALVGPKLLLTMGLENFPFSSALDYKEIFVGRINNIIRKSLQLATPPSPFLFPILHPTSAPFIISRIRLLSTNQQINKSTNHSVKVY
jgi:hypothetical protein